MRQSTLFTKTRKEAPKDEEAKNAELLIRAGFVHKEMAGVYSYLPLGLRVLRRIEQVVREEMDAIGGQEIVMTALQDKELWARTDRWDDKKVDNWFKTALKSGGETGLAITHEEPLTRIMTDHISSYRDLPVFAYQFQNKFRNEMRAKSGVMRGREFLMKDLYSFAATDEQHEAQYAAAREAYKRIFERLGIGDRTFITFASGGVFSDFSEEFQTLSDAGEDLIYLDEETGVAVNKEVLTEETLEKLGLSRESLVEKKAIEAGNIFHLGTRFSETLGLTYTDADGSKKPVIMGSYGIGISRMLGILVETLSDEKGMVWPESVAPFLVHLVPVVSNDETVMAYADALYADLQKAGVSVLLDDRDLRAGEKLADADLIGIPARVVIGKKTIETGQLESTYRRTGETKLVSRDELLAFATSAQQYHGKA